MSKNTKYIQRTITWLKNLDWKNPRILFSGIAFGILPFVAKHYFFTGLILGLLLAIAVLWILEKSPQIIKDLTIEYPLVSDIILSSFAIITLGGYFGSGLMLGIASIVCALAISFAIATFTEQQKLNTI